MPSESETSMRHRRDLLKVGVGLAGSLLVLPAFAQGGPEQVGTVEEMKGVAFAEQDGKRRPLALKAAVFVGDVLSTENNARLTMKLGAATTIKLGGASRLKIDRYLADVGGEFDMQAGHMMFERGGKPASQGITFRSAYGLMAVRGTRFFAGPSRGVFGVLVGRGLVEVTAGKRSVLVQPQQGVDIKAPGEPPTAPAAWREARIREMQRNFI
jgi:ferric-dicitrate binding protein FerR (iron transport regulator)